MPVGLIRQLLSPQETQGALTRSLNKERRRPACPASINAPLPKVRQAGRLRSLLTLLVKAPCACAPCEQSKDAVCCVSGLIGTLMTTYTARQQLITQLFSACGSGTIILIQASLTAGTRQGECSWLRLLLVPPRCRRCNSQNNSRLNADLPAASVTTEETTEHTKSSGWVQACLPRVSFIPSVLLSRFCCCECWFSPARQAIRSWAESCKAENTD